MLGEPVLLAAVCACLSRPQIRGWGPAAGRWYYPCQGQAVPPGPTGHLSWSSPPTQSATVLALPACPVSVSVLLHDKRPGDGTASPSSLHRAGTEGWRQSRTHSAAAPLWTSWVYGAPSCPGRTRSARSRHPEKPVRKRGVGVGQNTGGFRE